MSHPLPQRPNNRAMMASLAPGVLLCVGITLAAALIERVEIQLAGRAWLEPLVIAILLGAMVRTIWNPGSRWVAGVAFCAKTVLEVAVVLLGASISAAMIADAGFALLLGIVCVVCLAITLSYGLGRLFGLPHRMSVLIACGNSICGNSAIAAVAPVIGAKSEDIASSIAFTAILGIVVVLVLPMISVAYQLTPREFGIFAGLTVYAVPQVLAATVPISTVSAQIGMLVKLIRVLMLGPVVLALSLFNRSTEPRSTSFSLHQFVPWFIVGFLVLVGIRSAGLIPPELLQASSWTASWMTSLSMAALGLGVDIRVVAKAGVRVTSVVTLSLIGLAVMAMTTFTC